MTMKTNQKLLFIELVTIRHAFQLLAILAVGCFLSACKQNEKVTKISDISGVYNLVSVDGNNIPANISHDGAALQIRSGVFTINSDGTCKSKMVFVPPSGSEATREVAATYTKEGSKLNMQWEGAGKTIGNIDGNTFTMNNEGMVLKYQK